MECPYCGAELVCEDFYGKTKYADHYYLYPRSWIEREGDIYRCPNIDSDENKECCESATFNGLFYTDSNGNLHEGYPC